MRTLEEQTAAARQVLRGVFGFDGFRPGQDAAIEAFLARRRRRRRRRDRTPISRWSRCQWPPVEHRNPGAGKNPTALQAVQNGETLK